jgi:hypothetical protein
MKKQVDQSVKSLTGNTTVEKANHIIPVSRHASTNLREPRPDTSNKSSGSKEKELKSSLLARLTTEHLDVDASLVYQAVNEAHALASLTTVPLLLLPLLAEEKVQKAAAWSVHQRSLRHGNRLALAA